ncbi:2-C-methyl-D-erythritol 2,4-cyclodiphosphate synthase [Brochothrix thermosphacta]|mgnify:CR=1 FL=1|uniref:2-C-methyl-D-erythritol 2,4-cyclodiphosphate synthase n=1 Tax=Brochothrix thermosphacta TaxID=2756 RepID=UPI000E731B7F|nr:2-C-methyl-D-erythritol 2,4-cyclodiphosphate synthase [Brochothrix thermosphacta]ANZ96625.1 2-C-methyl-D-erythritol 2,4-cyclodiphosphate synthase [Brochothrix thermosphacta]
MSVRIGQGYDVHQLVEGRLLVLGGIVIPHTKGLLGHSDADVLLHAIIDALLGAAGHRDIGYFFPDTDDAFKDIDSKQLLRQVWVKVQQEGYQLGNIDSTIVAQKPHLSIHIPLMQQTIADIMKVDPTQIGIKVTTNEHLGPIGREEGIAALAVALLEK